MHALKERSDTGMIDTQCGLRVPRKDATAELWRVTCEECRVVYVDMAVRKAALLARLRKDLEATGQRFAKQGFRWMDIVEGIAIVCAGFLLAIEQDSERLKFLETTWPKTRRETKRQLKAALETTRQKATEKKSA